MEPGRVSIYFPAEKETSKLRFHLHAPFASTVARDSVRDCEANDELRDHLADLIAESMTAIRDQGLLTVGFLATLPNDEDKLSPFYKPILDRLVKTFQSENLTPMKKGGHAAAIGVFRGRPAPLSDLIVDADLATLLGEEYSPPLWIANPPLTHHRDDKFLSMLDISKWTTEDLVLRLNELLNSPEWTTDEEFISRLNDLDEDDQAEQTKQWLSKKSDKWHGRLYSLLGDELLDYEGDFKDYFYSELFLQLPIVRISDGTYSKGEDCFFPDGEVEHDQTFPRVAKGVCSSKKTRKFLKAIGVREVGEAEQVEAILKQRYSQEPIKPRKQDMKRFITLIEKELDQADLFKDYYIFQLESGEYGKPSEVFLDSPYLDTGLKAYYDELGESLGQKWALSPKYKESGIKSERFTEFVKKVGVQTKLEAEKKRYLSDHTRYLWWRAKGRRSEYEEIKDYDIPAFDILLDQPKRSKSQLIWDTMKELPDTYLRASYRPNASSYPEKGKSTLVHKLRENKWVPQKQSGQKNIDFVKPSEAVVGLLPKGFSYEPEAGWLAAVEFGKAERDRKEEERQKKEQATREYQGKSEAAQEVGFSSLEEAQEAKEVLELKREDPEGFKKWEEGRKPKPAFPEKSSRNPERRQKKLVEHHANASEKEYETRERSVRITRGTIDPDTWLKNEYTHDDTNQMVCQICKEEMPFGKRDGEYYFEAVEALSKDYFSKEHGPQFLALCPLCAAMYKEFVKNDESAMQDVKDKLTDSDGLEIPLRLGELDTSIRFVETHRQDLKTILQN